MDSIELPVKPEKPLDSDCCGNGCIPCVMDIYEEELRIWEKECLKLQRDGDPNDETEDENEDDVSLSPDQYEQFRIISIVKETHDSYRYRFKLQKGKCLGLTIGQHIIIRGYIEGSPVTRQYTPVSDINTEGYFELLIKIYATGKMSQVVRTWQKDEKIDMRGPCGNFVYTRNKYSTIYMLCMGTGVAPMSQVIQAVLEDDREETKLRLVYRCRTYSDILLKHELDAWSQFWNFSVLYVLSQENVKSPPSYRYGEDIHLGRMDKTLVEKELSDKHGNILVLICGTKDFETDMIQHLIALGLSESEYFRF